MGSPQLCIFLRISHGLDQPQTPYVANDDLKLLILLPLPPKY